MLGRQRSTKETRCPILLLKDISNYSSWYNVYNVIQMLRISLPSHISCQGTQHHGIENSSPWYCVSWQLMYTRLVLRYCLLNSNFRGSHSSLINFLLLSQQLLAHSVTFTNLHLLIKSEQITNIYTFKHIYRLFLAIAIVSINWYRILTGRGKVRELC